MNKVITNWGFHADFEKIKKFVVRNPPKHPSEG
jgi:hypothetical protein